VHEPADRAGGWGVFLPGRVALCPKESSMSLEESDRAAAAVAVAPRVALSDIEAKIVARYDTTADLAFKGAPFHLSLPLLSICVLVMRNGFTVIGKSAPASAQNFNAELGRKFAYEDAIRQLWPLEGYALRERLASG